MVGFLYLLVVAEVRIRYQNDASTPLGVVRVVAEQWGTRGLASGPMRVFGSYALVVIASGNGRYRDAHSRTKELAPGSAILVLPDVPHTYATRHPAGWDEAFVTFDGPLFDGLRRAAILTPDQLVFPTSAAWRERWHGFLRHRPQDAAARLRHVAALHELLVDLVADTANPPLREAENPWLAASQAMLERHLERPMELAWIALELGVSEQTFRKRFAREAGVSPARFRAARRIAAAENLLRQTAMTHRQIAEALGYADEFHFAKHFKAATGNTPRDYRRGMPA